MINRINAKLEKVLREAINEVTRIEGDQIPPSLTALDEQERAEVLSLALTVTAYVLVEACGSQWPVRSSIRKIADALAAGTSFAERLHLDPEVIYAYLSRTVFGKERLEDVIPDEPDFTRLPIVVAGEALSVYTKGYKSMWDYLDRAESGIEEASALDPIVLPGAVMRAYMKQAE
jgi:hypothetical protein